MSLDEFKKDLDRLSDKEHLENLIGGIMIRKNSAEAEKDGSKAFAEHLLPVLQKCLDNMAKMAEMTDKLSNVSENLVIERISNKRMRTLIEDAAGILHGNPKCYPPPLCDLVARIHKEVGLIK